MKEWTIFVLISLKFTFDGTTLANLSLALLINVCVLAPGSNLQGEIESGTLPKKGSAPSYLSAMYTEFILLVGAPLSTFA